VFGSKPVSLDQFGRPIVSPHEPTTFILGAGFSAGQQFPLVRGLRERVIHFLEAEFRSTYRKFLRPEDGYPKGQFYEGLDHIDPEGQLGFEELLIELSRHLRAADPHDGCLTTDKVLRIGVARLLWCIAFFIWRVNPSFESFARRLAAARGEWRVVSFNWDILVERSLHEVGASWTYSLRAASESVPIVKPHGSINWSSFRQNPSRTSEYIGWEPIAPGSTLSYDKNDPLANPDLQETHPDLRYCLFPGDPDLPQSHPDIGLLWEEVRESIRTSDHVVFIGYSLPFYDTFAGEFFRTECAHKRIDVHDPSSETRGRFQQSFPDATVHDQKFRFTPYAR
jgi:hypothetical protein